jgi:hypothetical protein
MTTLTKTRTKVQVKAGEHSQAGLDSLSQGSLAVMGGISALIGIWAAACFVGALITGGGPLAMATGWFSAITGM